MAEQGIVASFESGFRQEILRELQAIEEQLKRIADHLEKYPLRERLRSTLEVWVNQVS